LYEDFFEQENVSLEKFVDAPRCVEHRVTFLSQTMVTVMPPCSLPGFGGGTTAQSFSRYHFYSLEAATADTTSSMQQQQQPLQQQQQHYKGKSIQNHEYHNNQITYTNNSRGKNIYNNSYNNSQAENMSSSNGQPQHRVRAAASGMGKHMAQRDTRTTSSASGAQIKSRGKNMLNYTSAVTVNATPTPSSLIRTTRGKVMPTLQQQQQQQQQPAVHIVEKSRVNFAQSSSALLSAISSSTPSSVAVITPSSSSSSLGSSSSRMMQQDQSGQDDMSRGEGGPPRVRYPLGGPATTKPLFVDCSVEYELPKMAKIPLDSLPLVMIHPKWQQNKPNTRSSTQQQPPQQQQQQQQIQLMQQQQQQQQHQHQHSALYANISNMSCPQCPPPASVTSSRGRKRPHTDYQQPLSNEKRTSHTGEFLLCVSRIIAFKVKNINTIIFCMFYW